MPNPLPFHGPYLKAERAKHHIEKLEAIFAAHLRANKKAITPNYNRKPRKNTTVGGRLPRHTPTVLGDALHNLRASLDHAYCIMVESNGGTINKHVKFPFTEKGTRQDLKGSIEGHAKAGCGPKPEVIDFIIDKIQPFPGGNGEDLLRLHILDIADKHMILLPTQQRTMIDNISFVGGSSISGITIVTSGDASAIFADNGIEQGAHNKASFEICFGDGQPFEGQPLLPMVRRLHGRVVETLNQMQMFI